MFCDLLMISFFEILLWVRCLYDFSWRSTLFVGKNFFYPLVTDVEKDYVHYLFCEVNVELLP